MIASSALLHRSYRRPLGDVVTAGIAGRHPTAEDNRAKVVETKPKKPSRSRRVTVDEDEPDLIAAK